MKCIILGPHTCYRHETIGQEREGDADRERAAFGRVLFGSRTIIVTKQHQQVQSYGSRGTKTTIATGMLEREPPRRGLTEVRDIIRAIITLPLGTPSLLSFCIMQSYKGINPRSDHSCLSGEENALWGKLYRKIGRIFRQL